MELHSDSYEVRGLDGGLRWIATREQAREAVAAGVVEPVGRTCVKYLRVKREAQTRLQSGSRTTRPVRGDRSCRVYGDGQLMGGLLEHLST